MILAAIPAPPPPCEPLDHLECHDCGRCAAGVLVDVPTGLCAPCARLRRRNAALGLPVGVGQ